ncbi:histidinol-phosphate aminotransferase [Virgibacillus natechei]|uniref:Histidinol-phosphate aminotransferase n=1 Tax=Virgibacillus natechei TaxID=1216297 RepID=A0ABS4IH16_9BACI|nr:histidinol-phosphate transaminase [Virgibacillus natechei]MBP1969606.1 histidinol-phosphate aminotransferase [Virgibacillus natechei]UZD11337.1 histidinol-phosphate transaminase [Virgibacillus natechei]
MEGKLILKQLTPYQQGKQIKDIKEAYGLDRIVKLASNENPYGYSSHVKDYFSNNITDFEIYPDGYTAELRTAIASKLAVNEKQLLFGSGSEEIVQMICRAFLYPGVNTVMPTPTFPQYKHNTLIEGADIKEIPTVDGYHDLEKMLESIDEYTKVVWLCSPNNPTGSSLSKEAIYSFMDRCPKDVLVVLDEAYYEYMDASQDPGAVHRIETYENLVILRTFSKAHGLAGLRIGYAIANEDLITKLDVVRGPFNTTSIAQKAALIALEDSAFIEETKSKNNTVKQDFMQFLDTIEWTYYESQANFLLVNTPISGNEVFQYLIENGFIVRPGEVLGCPNTIRVTLGNEKDMSQLQNLLYAMQQQLSKEI